MAFLLMLAAIVFADRFFATTVFQPYQALMDSMFGANVADPALFAVDALPEVWFALIALVLGTLLLVISITSQSIPRLIDIYLSNNYSVLFIWYLIIGAAHSLSILLYGSMPLSHPSKVFNLHFLLPLGLFLTFPYTYYILRRSKPDNVIENLHLQIQTTLDQISDRRRYASLNRPAVVLAYQKSLLEALNQLDDIFSYITFKGPRASIITVLGEAMRRYMAVKPRINPSFLRMSAVAKSDISFMTISNLVASVDEAGTLFEQKVMRLLRNAYVRMIATNDYDLASLCAKELNDSCSSVLELSTASEVSDNVQPSTRSEGFLDFFIIWFNTFMRVAIKNAEGENDLRHLFNLLFYYGTFAQKLIEKDRRDTLKKVFRYLRIYGEELYNKSRRQRSLEFVVDVVAAEMRNALELACERGWPSDLQEELLRVLMTVDRQPRLSDPDDKPEAAISLGVRLVQIGLALYYLEKGRAACVAIIVEDLKEDFDSLGRDRFLEILDLIFLRLRAMDPVFWEDTDRGNKNLYYTPYKEQIPRFEEIVTRRVCQPREVPPREVS